MDFPIFNSKVLSPDTKEYGLFDPVDRQRYFKSKLGSKIEDIKAYLDNQTFVAYMVAKKNGGKSSYFKMFQELVGVDRAQLVSIGDIIRDTHKNLENADYEKELLEYAKKHYRGFNKIEEIPDIIKGRSQDKLIPTEIILLLLKRQIAKLPKKALFLDGLPRDFDQVSVSLFFREIINYREDPDFFILFSIPESVLEARMKSRNVCPLCKTSKDLKHNPSTIVFYDKYVDRFKMLCDNQDCPGYKKQELVEKDGDAAGMESIRERLDKDGELIEMVSNLQGVEKIYIRNDIPLDIYREFVDDYELTSEYSYEEVNGAVKVSADPWVIKNDPGEDVVSITTANGVVSMVSQLHKILFESNA